MSIFGDLGTVARRAGPLAREHWLGLVGRSLLVAASLFAIPLAGIGIVLAGVAIFGMYASASGHGASAGQRGRTFARPATGFALVGASAVAGLAESAAAPLAIPGIAGIVTSALVGMALAPLHLASVTLLVEDRSFEEALGRVLVATTSRGQSVLAVGALQGVLTVGAATWVMVLAPVSGLASFVLFHGVVAVGSVVHVVTSVAAYEALVKDHRGDFHAPRLGRVALVLAPATLALALALAFALAAPLPAWIDRPVSELDGALDQDSAAIVTRTGLTVTPRGSVLVVSVPDGGGCGSIGGFASVAAPASVVPTTFRDRPAFEIGRRGFSRVAFVDADGVRLDDTLADRLRYRMGLPVFVPLAIAGAVLVVLFAMLRAASSTARFLGASDIHEAHGSAMIAVTGQLRLGEGARVSLGARGRSRIEGSVRFESNDAAMSVVLEEGLRALGQCSPVSDEAPAFVVASARELRAGTHRSAPRRNALLIGLGTLDDARQAFLTRESRRLVWLGIPAALAILVAAGAMLAVG